MKLNKNSYSELVKIFLGKTFHSMKKENEKYETNMRAVREPLKD